MQISMPLRSFVLCPSKWALHRTGRMIVNPNNIYGLDTFADIKRLSRATFIMSGF
jgi:hypothetical protein